MFRGVRLIGNEFNILSGGCYLTKEGFDHLLRTYPGLDAFPDVTLGVPIMQGGFALVPFDAAWSLNGAADSIAGRPASSDGGPDTRIPVKVNSGMGADALLGKATRKAYARIYAKVSRQHVPEGDADSDDVLTVSRTTVATAPGAAMSLEDASEPSGETPPAVDASQSDSQAGAETYVARLQKAGTKGGAAKVVRDAKAALGAGPELDNIEALFAEKWPQ